MKLVTVILMMIFSTLASGETKSLSYNDSIIVPKTISINYLPVNFMKIHRIYFGERRMIAGKFDTTLKKKMKMGYLDGLRSKLAGCKGISRI